MERTDARSGRQEVKDFRQFAAQRGGIDRKRRGHGVLFGLRLGAGHAVVQLVACAIDGKALTVLTDLVLFLTDVL